MTRWSSPERTVLAGAAGALFLGAISPPSLVLPVDCDMGPQCSVQKHVDHDPSGARRDFACGRLTTDGHDGTDFRLNRYADVKKSVDVLAAAAGTVLRVRDGEPDVSVLKRGLDAVGTKKAGNAVVISHGDGWETQYSHLKRGSLTVAPGDTVHAGEPLGRIGLSGMSEFPHLHFEVRRGAQVVDPFAPDGVSADCHGAGTLWAEKTARALRYRSTGILDAGFAAEPEEAKRAPRSPEARPERLDAPEALILWGASFGVMEGDIQRFEIFGPDGSRVHLDERRLGQPFLEARAFSGFRLKSYHSTGNYTGFYSLVRDNRTFHRKRTEITVQR